MMKVLFQLGVALGLAVMLAHVFAAATRKPQVPLAGSQMTSSVPGEVISTMS